MRKHLNIDDDESKQEFINSLKDLVDIANKVADSTSYRETAFEIVLENLVSHMFHEVSHMFHEECDCDPPVDQMKLKKTAIANYVRRGAVC